MDVLAHWTRVTRLQMCYISYVCGILSVRAIVADGGYGGETLRHQTRFDKQLITVADAGYRVWRPDLMAPDGF